LGTTPVVREKIVPTGAENPKITKQHGKGGGAGRRQKEF